MDGSQQVSLHACLQAHCILGLRLAGGLAASTCTEAATQLLLVATEYLAASAVSPISPSTVQPALCLSCMTITLPRLQPLPAGSSWLAGAGAELGHS